MKNLQLILTNPCSEQWEDMQSAGTGRYCDTCEKHIIDLTDKSDAELIQFFNKKKENVCGRLLSTQLNRELVAPPKNNWYWAVPLAIGAMALNTAQAQELRPLIVENDLAPASPATINSAQPTPIPAKTITGKVLNDQTGQPLQGVKVRQKGFDNVLAITDSAGLFKLNIEGADPGSIYTFELNGYLNTETKLNDGMVIKLAYKPITIRLGGITTVSASNEPLYVVDAGDKSCTLKPSAFKSIEPEWIESLQVMKPAEETAIYGSKAAKGVILIKIKQAHMDKIDFSQKL